MIVTNLIRVLSFCLLLFVCCTKVEWNLTTSREAPGFDNEQSRHKQQRELQNDPFSNFDLDFNLKGRLGSKLPNSRRGKTKAPVSVPSGRVVTRDKLAETSYDRDDELPPEAEDAAIENVPTPAPYYDVVIVNDDIPWDLTEDEPETDPKEGNGPTTAPTTKELIYLDADDDDYTAVVIGDDVPWDDIAMNEKAKDVFEAIEMGELDESDQIEDYDLDVGGGYNSSNDDFQEELFYPSAEPTNTHQPTDSDRPTALRSAAPTNHPTSTPSLSSQPSDYPSSLPTDMPSMVPSASPSKTCHDNLWYRSPINGLSCSHHFGTNCLNWRHIGLNMTELEELLISCPETCNIECGSFHLFSTEISFRISRVSGFMDQDDVEEFFDFSIEYLEDYVRSIGWIGPADDVSGSNDSPEESKEEVSLVYDDDFLNDDFAEGSAVVFEIENAKLSSQQLVEHPSLSLVTPGEATSKPVAEEDNDGVFRRVRPLRSRAVEEIQRTKQKQGGESIVKTDEALDVRVKFEGFTIGMNPKSMSELLVLGIDDVDFTRKLQKSGIDFFSEATVSSAMETLEEDVPSEDVVLEGEEGENSTFTIVISYMVPIVVIGFAVGSIFYHRCYKKGRWTILYQNRNPERTQFGGMSTVPIAADIDNSNNSNSIVTDGSEGDGRLFTVKRESSNDSAANGAKDEGDKQSAFAKLMSTLSLNITLTKSKNSTDEEGESEEPPNIDDGTSGSSSSDERETKKRKAIPVIESPLVSPMSGETESHGSASTDKGGFNTYASVLPPMIVIDNIDISEPDSTSPEMTATNPSRGDLRKQPSVRSTSSSQLNELDAFASEFRKQLQKNSRRSVNSTHPSFTGTYYDSFSGAALDVESERGLNYLHVEDVDDGRQIVDTVSEDWDGDDLFPPIPANITAEGDENDDEVGLDDELDQDHLASRSIRATSPTTASAKKSGYGTWGANQSSFSAEFTDTDTNLSASSLPTGLHRGAKSDLYLRRRGPLPPKRPPTPERGSTTRNNANGSTNDTGNDKDNKRSSFSKSTAAFSFTPIARALMGGGSSVDSGGHKRKSSTDTTDELHLMKNSSSLSGLSNDDAMNSSTKSNTWKDEGDTRLEFEAPRKGNWGLVLESSSMTGPRIYAVKDYSPLFGLVKKGDKLIEIDGKNVCQSNLSEVTKILKGKSSSYHYQRTSSTSMPIVVSRNSSSNTESSFAEAPVVGSFAYNTSYTSTDRHHLQEQYSSYDHKRKGSYGSWGSNGSRVLEDIDEHYENNEMGNNQLPQRNYHDFHDGSNEI